MLTPDTIQPTRDCVAASGQEAGESRPHTNSRTFNSRNRGSVGFHLKGGSPVTGRSYRTAELRQMAEALRNEGNHADAELIHNAANDRERDDDFIYDLRGKLTSATNARDGYAESIDHACEILAEATASESDDLPALADEAATLIARLNVELRAANRELRQARAERDEHLNSLLRASVAR